MQTFKHVIFKFYEFIQCYILYIDYNRGEIELHLNDDDNHETRKKFKMIKVTNGNFIHSHLICDRCFQTFSILDKHGHKTGITTLNRHLNNCTESMLYTKISDYGKLATKSIYIICSFL